MSRRAFPTRFVVCCSLLVPVLLGAQRSASRAQARLEGTVRDSSGAQIPNAGIAVAGEAAPRSVSDDSGAFRILGLAPGRRILVARRFGFRPETLTVDVFDGRTTRADFVLRRAVVQLEAEQVTADSARVFKMGA